MDRTALRFNEAELHRLKGELLLDMQNSGFQTEIAPEACFHQALEIARRQQAKSWELRVAMSLHRLWCQEGKTQPAQDLLRSIYQGFSEGFETPDLQEARAMLTPLETQAS